MIVDYEKYKQIITYGSGYGSSVGIGYKKIALITGITGMDGSIMADFLLDKGYVVHGIIRRSSNFNTNRISHILDKIYLHYGDLNDMGNIINIIGCVRPDEIYNFAAMSHVKVSFDIEKYTFESNTIGILNILQSVKILGIADTVRIYHASTSEQFGNITDGSVVLNEKSPMIPVSPYGISKLAAYHLCNYYRDAYRMFVVTSILFNHEGERRGPTFVTKKIANYIGRYSKAAGCIEPLQLGNLDSKRDWGYANDYMEGVWAMMQHSIPDNYVLATGETHTVREFVELAFSEININIAWCGHGDSEYGIDSSNGNIIVQVTPDYYRAIDIHALIGDYSKAKDILGWEPQTSFRELVQLMVSHSIKN